MEIGQQAMPKPLLSGYFTNNLNSVRNVNEVQKSLEDVHKLEETYREISQEAASPRISSDMTLEKKLAH